MTAWKVRRAAHSEAPGIAADTTVFVAPSAGQTYQNAGTLKLTAAEAEDLELKLESPQQKQPHSADLNAEEYNKLQEFLLEWSEQDLTALYLADMIRKKFGASVRRTSEG